MDRVVTHINSPTGVKCEVDLTVIVVLQYMSNKWKEVIVREGVNELDMTDS